MKIAVSANAGSLDAALDPRFGRCPFFVIVDTEDFSFEAFENQSAMLGGGAGIQSAQFMSQKGVKFILTGNCGPNAYQTLSAADIGIITGCSGTVREVAENFKSGKYGAAQAATVESHFGTGASNPGFIPGQGGGRGMGKGGGMGQGGGRGMGKGGGRGMR